MAAKKSSTENSLENFLNLSQSLYEESNIKGLDYSLLRNNRERIERQKKFTEERSKLLTSSAAIFDEKPKQFVTPMAKEIYSLITSAKNHFNNLNVKHNFVRDRMLFEFDTTHDRLNRFNEHIPTKIFRSLEEKHCSEPKVTIFKN